MERHSAVTHGGPDSHNDSAAAYQLKAIRNLLLDILSEREQPLDFDQAWTVMNGGAIAVVNIGPIPRTIRHVQVEVSIDNSAGACAAALFDGAVTLAQAEAQYAPATTAGVSQAMLVSDGGQVKTRDFLGGSGVLTVYFTAAVAAAAVVRIRSLDNVPNAEQPGTGTDNTAG